MLAQLSCPESYIFASAACGVLVFLRHCYLGVFSTSSVTTQSSLLLNKLPANPPTLPPPRACPNAVNKVSQILLLDYLEANSRSGPQGYQWLHSYSETRREGRFRRCHPAPALDATQLLHHPTHSDERYLPSSRCSTHQGHACSMEAPSVSIFRQNAILKSNQKQATDPRFLTAPGIPKNR